MNEGLIKKIVWLLFTLLGVALVISIAPALTMLLMAQFGMSTTMVLAIEIALALVLALISWLIAGPLVRATMGATRKMEGKLQKMSTQDLLSGAIGLIK